MSGGTFDMQVSNVLRDLEKEVEKLGVFRVNSTMLLRALLEAEDSPLYTALLSQVEDMTFFPEMLSETYEYVFMPETAIDQEDMDSIPKIIYTDGEDTKVMFFDDDLSDCLSLIVNSFELGEIVDIWKLSAFFVSTMSPNVRRILRTFGVQVELLKPFFEQYGGLTDEDTAKTFKIPQEFKSFLRNFNEELRGNICDISGRNRECNQVWRTMMKQTKRNVVLIGEPGVGKTSIVIKMVYDIINGTCPEEFKGFTILSLDVASSVAGTMYRGQAEQRYSDLVDFLEDQPNIILFIDEIHLINGAGACREGEIDLANTLKPILAGGKVRVIGATTQDEYEKYFSRDGAIKRRFHPVYVKEPKMKEVYSMLKKSIENLSKYHGVSITEEMVDFIILNAACFNKETCDPDRTKDLIDLSMVVAKQSGKDAVDKTSVLANFAYHFRQFANMSDRAKRSTAYHEAGHCLMAMCSKRLGDRDVVAVSIMPTDSYLGVTVYEGNDTTPEPTMEYFIDCIAVDLAGRVAEKMFTNTITSGAWGDLQKATRTAHNIVTRYGLAEFGKNRNYTEETQNERTIDKINEEIDNLISIAMKRAEEILGANRDALNMLVETLMKKGIVGPKDLQKIEEKIVKM